MSTINPVPLFMKDALFTITDEYAAAISSVAFTPSVSTSTFQGLRPAAQFAETNPSTWTCDLTFAQDWDTPGSLSNFLLANEGNKLAVVFVPKNGGASISATLTIAPGAIGGAAAAFATATVSLGVSGKPVVVPAAATIPTVTGANVTGGGIAGGNVVKIVGTKFTGVVAAGVKFGTTASPSIVVDSDQAIYAVAPAQAAGSKPITVTNPVGVSTTSAPYTYA